MKRAQELEFALEPRPEGVTLQRWLYSELRSAILSGRLAPGQRLPSSRDFARQQDISRGTVLSVYEQLIAEGYLLGATGSGTTVSPALPIKPQPLPHGSPLASPLAAANGPAPKLETLPVRLSAQGRLLTRSPFPRYESLPPIRPFRPNQPDVSAFPMATWRQLANRYARSRWERELGYGDAAGYMPLRRAIADHLHYSQRIACDPQQVIIFSGTQQALDVTARLLLDPGDGVLVEDPGYPGAVRIFELAGARVIGVPVDLHGLRTDPLLPRTPDMRLAYVTAAHQSPLGGSLPLERRLALLEWAEACNAIVIEDDYDGEYRFHGQPLPALKSLGSGEHVIYMGSSSKLLFPSLRLSYMVVPPSLADAYASALSLTCRHAPVYQQAVMAAFIDEGHFARHLHRMRLLYGERARIFQDEFRARFDGKLSLLPASTGLDATALLPEEANDNEVAAALHAAGIEARAISFYRFQQKAPPGLVMGFSSFGEAAIRKGMDAMAKVLDGTVLRP
jgi:GntR family transcriptional regulator/MocR family aminotransferase